MSLIVLLVISREICDWGDEKEKGKAYACRCCKKDARDWRFPSEYVDNEDNEKCDDNAM